MNVACNSCGNGLEIKPGLVSIVCEYCGSLLILEKDIIVSTGQKTTLVPFPSMFKLGDNFYIIEDKKSNDRFLGKKITYISERNYKGGDFLLYFNIYGHIRFYNDGGFWDNWYIRILKNKSEKVFGNNDFLIEEDEGLINIYENTKSFYIGDNNSPKNIFGLSVGTNTDYGFIQEKGECLVEGIEGQLNFFINTNDVIEYIMCYSDGGFVKFEMNSSQILFYSNK